jgi:purine-binding chemotaxis protein CheW
MTTATPELTQLVVFQLHEHEYALPATRVVEVLRMVALTPVPEAPAWLPGVLNLRGFVIPVVDLRTRLGLPADAYALNTPIIVVNGRNRRLGLIADAMVDVVALTADALEHFERSAADQSVVVALAHTGNRVILVLDADRVLAGTPELI